MFGIGPGGYDNLKGQFGKIRDRVFGERASQPSESPRERYKHVEAKKPLEKEYADAEMEIAYRDNLRIVSKQGTPEYDALVKREIEDLREELGRVPESREIEKAIDAETKRRARKMVEMAFGESRVNASRAAVYTKKD